MQTRKKGCRRNVSKDPASQRVSRPQKRYAENAQPAEKKVSELITSSIRRQRVGSLQKKNEVPVIANGSDTGNSLVDNEIVDASLRHDAVIDDSLDHKSCEEGAGHNSEKTIFSPSFHSSTLTAVNSIYQHHGKDQSQDDMKNYCYTTRYSECKSIGEKKNSDYILTSMDKICSSNLDIDEDMSSKTSDASVGDMMFNPDSDAPNTNCDMEIDGARLSSEVSAIYFAMRNSKLECVDEHGQETVTADACVQDEEYDDFDDFDPYFFIKNLPDLSSVVPTFRPMLLPKQTRSCPATSLVLDLDVDNGSVLRIPQHEIDFLGGTHALSFTKTSYTYTLDRPTNVFLFLPMPRADGMILICQETLVHSTLEPCDDADFTFPVNFNLQEYTVYVRCRPHLRDFMERVASLFEIIIFTASQSIYAEQLLNMLDPKRKIFRHRVYRDSCVYVEGNYLKDLSILGRDLAHVIIIDNSPQAFGFQVDNGIPIESWFDNRTDQELLRLLPFLESLAGVEDVRPVIAKKYNLREKVTAAVYPQSNLRRGDPLER